MPTSASSILVYGGASCGSSTSEAQSRKVVRLEGMKIVFIDLKWINAQGKGMIFIGFLFYRSSDVVGRSGFRIGNRTIKRGSQVSFSILFVESSNICIIGIIFIGSYLSLIVVWSWSLSCLSWQGQGHRKRFSYVFPIEFSVSEILPVHLCGRFHSSI